MRGAKTGCHFCILVTPFSGRFERQARVGAWHTHGEKKSKRDRPRQVSLTNPAAVVLPPQSSPLLSSRDIDLRSNTRSISDRSLSLSRSRDLSLQMVESYLFLFLFRFPISVSVSYFRFSPLSNHPSFDPDFRFRSCIIIIPPPVDRSSSGAQPADENRRIITTSHRHSHFFAISPCASEKHQDREL